MQNRTDILAKIRALLSKTVENGCTESEALSALTKARAMMDAYEVTDADVREMEQERAGIHHTTETDPHRIRVNLAVRVAEFADVRVWRSRDAKGRLSGLSFCGIPADVSLATWLLDTLAEFVRRELAVYLMRRGEHEARDVRRAVINGFVMGATRRINERLAELVAASRTQATANGRALVVTKKHLIAEAMGGIETKATRSRSVRVTQDAMGAGRAAGDRASFARPVSGSAGVLRLGSR
jgi:hypothetical protein